MINIPDSIFPKNEEGQEVCFKCKKILKECECPSYDPNKPKLEQFKPKVCLDKSGRRGKVVTCIEGLPSDETYLKKLTKKIKARVGSGGTFYVRDGQGIIEIQGNKMNFVKDILEKEK